MPIGPQNRLDFLSLYAILFADTRRRTTIGKEWCTNMGESILWYNRPAQYFTEALPVGNGSLGGMVYGGVEEERISLNEDTLWSGGPSDKTRPSCREALPRVRQLLAEDRAAEAEDMVWRDMLTTWTESYLPAGDLHIRLEQAGQPQAYRRQLDLTTALAAVSYELDGVSYTREVFCSRPHGIMVVRLRADRPGMLTGQFSLTSPLPFEVQVRADELELFGRAPSTCAPNYHPTDNPVRYDGPALRFCIAARLTAVGGAQTADAAGLRFEKADEVIVRLTAATNYAGYTVRPEDSRVDPAAICRGRLDEAAPLSYAQLKEAHLADYMPLYGRTSLSVEGVRHAERPTDERLVAAQDGGDTGLVELLFGYGRYLMLAASRPGTQPTNLQGIWNEELCAPWSSNYTLNINTPMNYWPAENANLSECHMPLFDMLRDLAQHGENTARVNYGCRGWCANHNTDLWRQTEGVGLPMGGRDAVTFGFWPMAGAWLARHIWEHYRYTMDSAFLREYWPVLRGAGTFLLDFLVEDKDGHLITSPATSPENRYQLGDGDTCAICQGSTMDLAIARDIFDICCQAGELLGEDAPLCADMRRARARLRPYQVGSQGQLLEWDREYDECDVHHRHLSHLYGFYPGESITPTREPALTEAVRRSLERRGDEATGWSLGWKINQWARLGEGDRVLTLLGMLMRPVSPETVQPFAGGGVYPNLFDAHPPFQIDGNFACTAGIVEMLVQSHEEAIRLLPALPAAWEKGEATGLCARSGFELSLRWEAGRLQRAVVLSRAGEPLRWYAQAPCRVVRQGMETVVQPQEGICTVSTTRGDTLEIYPL